MPIWPMPKQYTRGDEELVVDAYSFRFLPNKNHPDILAAAKRYTEMMFRDNGTGSYTDADGAAQAFEFALNGDNLTLALENGTVQMFRCTLENGLMYLTPMSNNGAYQAFTDVFRQTQSTADASAN